MGEVTPLPHWHYLNRLDLGTIVPRILDVEVSVRNKEDYSAFVPENKLCAIGILSSGNVAQGWYGRVDDETGVITGEEKSGGAPDVILNGEHILLVGHNIKYDLHWMMRERIMAKGGLFTSRTKDADPYVLSDIPLVWDTQLVEYLLSAQTVKMASLDELSDIYKLPRKPDVVKKLWEAGVLTKDINPDVLWDYLKHDLTTTREVYRRQLEQVLARPPEFQWLVMSQLNMLRLVTLMEWNGLCLDTKACIEERDRLAKVLVGLEFDIKVYTEHLLKLLVSLPIPAALTKDLNYTSNRTVSAILYGGVNLKYRQHDIVGTYKDGRPKPKWTDYSFVVPRHTFCGDHPPPLSADGITRPVDEDTLATLMTSGETNGNWIQYIEHILEHRRVSKLHGTYIEKLPTFLRNPGDSIIHHKLNQCITNTGRLSSSSPNMQNRPPEVTKLFKTRHEQGVILSVDFSQIELYALAQECQDPQLIRDLNEGVDIHWVTGCEVYSDWSMKKKDEVPARVYRDIKSVNFGLIYGGGNTTVAKQTKVSKVLVAKIRKALYTRYPMIETWQERNIKTVKRNAKVVPGTHLEGGLPAHFSILKADSGRMYSFFDELSPPWLKSKTGKDTSFSPTQIKNYPIQGLATGDWVPVLIGVIAFHLNNTTWVPINTTHDDIELDMRLGAETTKSGVENLKIGLERYVNEKIATVFPSMWEQWTGGKKLRVVPKVKVKVISTNVLGAETDEPYSEGSSDGVGIEDGDS